MPLYESVFIARQEISPQQADALAETFSNIITENGGTVGKKENWGLKSLAFRIKKNRKGHYVMLNVNGPASAVNEMERQMRLHEDVIRFLTVRVEELEEGPSIQQRAGRDRDDRDRDRPRRRFGSGAPREEVETPREGGEER